MQKTYKREVAMAMLAFLGTMFIVSLWFTEATQVAEYLTTPVFLFAAAAFGIDAYAKQVK